ncbi:unnamed protein product [Parajaminaea phylloscopi]
MAKKAAKTQASTGDAAAAPAAFDSELDALFSSAATKAAPVAATPAAALAQAAGQGRKRKNQSEDEPRSEGPSVSSAKVADAETQSSDDVSDDDEDAELDMEELEREMEEQGLARGASDEEAEEEEFQDGADVSVEGQEQEQEGSSSSSDDEDPDKAPPTHEALKGKAREVRVRRKLEEREEESKEVRDKRSIFVGNISIECVQSKTLTKALHKHIIAHSPYPSITRIESLRYRSVAFSTPTADYAAQSGAEAAANEKRRSRARAFRDAVAEAETADGKGPATVYLNANQKRKVAYINQDINEKAKSVNAYVTLEKIRPQDLAKLKDAAAASTSAAVSGDVDRLSTPILAALTAASADESVFEGRHLRLDLAKPLSLDELVSSGLDRIVSSSSLTPAAETLSRILSSGGSGGSGRKEDQSKTVFIGNLDFEADEEDLRAMLEGVLKEERGPSPTVDFNLSAEVPMLPAFEKQSEDDAAAEYRPSSWVHSVRIVRDPATQMGKGFAYVRFVDEICVDELMAIWESDEAFLAATKGGASPRQRAQAGTDGKREDGSRVDFKRRLKLNKRPLRLARCKATGGAGQGAKRRKLNGADQGPAGSASTTTPRKDSGSKDGPRRRRSQGAPTPGGSSPSTSRRPRPQNGDAGGSPQPRSRTAGAGGRSAGNLSGSSDQKPKKTPVAIVPNPSPQQPRSASDLARLELKRNDPERQAKRLAKKDRKRAEVTGGKAKGEAKGAKVDLSKEIKKQHQRGKPGAGASNRPPVVGKRKRKD